MSLLCQSFSVLVSKLVRYPCSALKQFPGSCSFCLFLCIIFFLVSFYYVANPPPFIMYHRTLPFIKLPGLTFLSLTYLTHITSSYLFFIELSSVSHFHYTISSTSFSVTELFVAVFFPIYDVFCYIIQLFFLFPL